MCSRQALRLLRYLPSPTVIKLKEQNKTFFHKVKRIIPKMNVEIPALKTLWTSRLFSRMVWSPGTDSVNSCKVCIEHLLEKREVCSLASPDLSVCVSEFGLRCVFIVTGRELTVEEPQSPCLT